MAVARAYWRYYTLAVIGLGLVTLFVGGVGGLLVTTMIPGYEWYYGLAAVSLILHISAVAVRDMLSGEYDPSQTTYSSGKQILALVVLIGFMFTAFLLIATAGAYLIVQQGLPVAVAAVFAAYYPIADNQLSQRGIWTPVDVIMVVLTELLVQVLNIRQSILDAVPIFRKRRRPQS